MADAPALARLCADAYAAGPDTPGFHRYGDTVRALVRDGSDGTRIIAFPGTRPGHITDDLTDIDCRRIVLDHPERQAHEGFWCAAMLALPLAIDTAMGGSLVLTGHSLGAALAVDLATALAIAGIPVAAVIGFGCPRTAVGPWQAEMLARAGIDVTLYRHGGDLVPLLPSGGGWAHAGSLVAIGTAAFDNIADHAVSAYVAALDHIRLPEPA